MNMELNILTKCGWTEKQINFLGTMVHNITDKEGNAIADIISNRSEEQISVEWFVPNKDGDKIGVTYSTKENKIIEDKTDSEIYDDKSLNAFLDTIENTINDNKGSFFPKSKIVVENKPKFSI